MAKQSTTAAATASQASTPAQQSATKLPKPRSPNYPSLNLQEAVARLPQLLTASRRNAIGVEVAVGAMGLKYTSSSGKMALGAMRSFGLLEDVGKGMVRLSQRALDLAGDYQPESQEYRAAMQEAALEPNMHQILWNRYHANLPADDELRRYLVREHRFYDNAVGQFIAEYRATIAYANLDETPPIGNNGHVESEKSKQPRVGDFVQWTSAGVDRLPSPEWH